MGGPRLLGCKLTLLPSPLAFPSVPCPLLDSAQGSPRCPEVHACWRRGLPSPGFSPSCLGAWMGSPPGGVSFTLHLHPLGWLWQGGGGHWGVYSKGISKGSLPKASLQAVGSAWGKRQGMSSLGLAEGLVPRTGRGCAVTIWQELWSWQGSHSHANPQPSKAWPREPTPWPLSTLTL